MQLVNPTAWDTSDPAALAEVLTQATELIESVGTSEECPVLEFRFTSSCVLQYSKDGGTTWVDTPGWATFAPGCFTGPAGATGATGAAGAAGATGATGATGAAGATGATGAPGTFDPGTPTNPAGYATDVLACGIAGYLATDVIKVSLQKVVDQINAGAIPVGLASAIAGAVLGLGALTGILAAAAEGVYYAIVGGTLSDYTAALADDTLWSDVTCAIWQATKTTGYVTDSNFAAVLTNLSAISYAHPAVVVTIHDYVAGLGAIGVRQAQHPGAVKVVDCSGCGLTGPSLQFSIASNTKVTLATDVAGTNHMVLGGWMSDGAAGVSQTVNFFGEGPPGHNHGYGILINGSNHPQAYINPGTGSHVATAPAAIDNGKHHLAMSYDGATLVLWVDGVAVASTACTGATLNDTSGSSYFGGGFAGKLWRWGIWSTTMLTSTQIAAWAAAGSFAPIPSGANHAWPFVEAAGTTVGDTAASPDNGTITPSAVWATHA